MLRELPLQFAAHPTDGTGIDGTLSLQGTTAARHVHAVHRNIEQSTAAVDCLGIGSQRLRHSDSYLYSGAAFN